MSQIREFRDDNDDEERSIIYQMCYKVAKHGAFIIKGESQ